MVWDKRVVNDQPPQSFSDYGESVFKRQNNATSRVMMLSLDEVEDKEAYEELLRTEKSMRNACEELNIYAEQSQNNGSSSLLLKARAGKSIKDCDQATQVLEGLLEDLDLAVFSPKSQLK
ncbi:MAG: hypothetical protein ABL903_03735 [Methylococcales bacterium]